MGITAVIARNTAASITVKAGDSRRICPTEWGASTAAAPDALRGATGNTATAAISSTSRATWVSSTVSTPSAAA